MMAVAQVGESLIKSKILIPFVRKPVVPRQDLLAHLDSAPCTKITLVSAPAGYGKTTLLACWANQSKLPVAWLSLDEKDNDPVRFATYLAATVDRIRLLDAEAAGLLQAASSLPLEAFLEFLLEQLEQSDKEAVLILQDKSKTKEPSPCFTCFTAFPVFATKDKKHRECLYIAP